MASDADAFVYRWLFDMRAFLERQWEALTYDLESGDKETRETAERNMRDIEAWLYPARAPLSEESKLERTRLVMENGSLSVEEKMAAMQHIARSTGRPRGRPRTETAQHAIAALSMHYMGFDWRGIALEVKGCNHKGRDEGRSCKPCGDAIRDAACRLETFLRRRGWLPGVSRYKTPRMSLAEFNQLL
jgi:hypothetical protein